MILGYVKRINENEFQTINGRVKIFLTTKKNHIHVRVSGVTRFSVLTNIKSDLTKLEKLAVAGFVFRCISDFEHLLPTGRNIRRAVNTNYAGVFGSMWIGAVE